MLIDKAWRTRFKNLGDRLGSTSIPAYEASYALKKFKEHVNAPINDEKELSVNKDFSFIVNNQSTIDQTSKEVLDKMIDVGILIDILTKK